VTVRRAIRVRTSTPNLFPVRQPTPVIETQMRAVGIPAWETEYCFAEPIGRKWRLDYAWPSRRIGFEQEGAVFGRSITGVDGQTYRIGGRHNTGAGLQADCEKYSWAAILGWRVIRATTTMIRDGKAIELLEAAFSRIPERT